MRWWYPEDGNRKNLEYTSTEDWKKKTVDLGEKAPDGSDGVYSTVDWESEDEPSSELVIPDRDAARYFWRRVLAFLVLPLLVVGGWVLWALREDTGDVREMMHNEAAAPAQVDEYIGAEEIVRRFMLERDPLKRLAYVREPEQVMRHLEGYPRQALAEKAYKVRKLGERVFEGENLTVFSVGFKNRSQRMLNVLHTEQGPKIDWDSYARYCEVPWETLLNGAGQEAEMRVIVMPGDYYNAPYDDRSKWTSFRLASPDLERDFYMYVEKGSLRELGLKTMLAAASEYRLHMILKLRCVDGVAGERLFTCEKVLAVGWVKGSRDEEDIWAEE